MSSCKCLFEDLSDVNLNLLSSYPNEVRNLLNLNVHDLFKLGEYEKIIKMAALLQGFDGCSEETINAIRAIVIMKIRRGLYYYPSEVIESIGKVVFLLNERKTGWTQELIKSLESQKDLESVKTWFYHRESLDKIAEVFQIIGTIESLLETAIDSDEVLNKFEFWEEDYTKIVNLVETFSFIRERIKEKAKNLLAKDGRLKTITEWSNRPFLVSSLIDNLGMEKEMKGMFAALIFENTQKVDGIHGCATEDCIKEEVDKLTESGVYSFMKDCLIMAKSQGIFIEPDDLNKYQERADNLLILANKLKDQETRNKIVKIACYIYKGLEEGYGYPFRNSIIKRFDEAGSDKDRPVLKEASKVLPFKYKRQSWRDF